MLPTIVTMLYIKYSDLSHHITESLYSIVHCLPLPILWQTLAALYFYEFDFFFYFYILHVK